MLAVLKNLRMRTKVSLLGTGSVLLTAIALMVLAVWQSGAYNTLAQHEVSGLIEDDLDNITRGAFNLVQTEHEAVQQQVRANLNVARQILSRSGGAAFSPRTVEWVATDQFTSVSRRVLLPRMLVGGKMLGRTPDAATESPVVDEVTHLTGESATIFQRMNDAGDMLRVATTVRTREGRRAIGTYIPHAGPDGAPNPVVKAVLAGEVYLGRAYVVNAWYITAYEPIRDRTGKTVGMLYVGVKQSTVEARVRQAILQTRVGKTGYVYVVAGKGVDRGHYVISQRGERDGEDLWDSRDSDGRFVIQAIIAKALALRSGQLTTERYRWQNQGEATPRWKIARLAYFAPWDWVIGTSVYEDELEAYREILERGRAQMMRVMGIAGLVICCGIGLLGLAVSWTITRPIKEMNAAVETIIDGDLTQVVKVDSKDEIGTLSRAFNRMTDMLNQTLVGLRASEEKYRSIFENAVEGLFQASFEGRFLNANQAMAHMLGYPSPEALKAGVSDMGSQVFADPEDLRRVIAALFETGEVSGQEYQLRHPNRPVLWASISVRMVHDGAGRPTCMEGFMADITGRKEAEAELERLCRQLEDKNAEMERFTYTVSHDLKSPLITIKGFMGYLAKDIEAGNTARAHEDIGRIQHAADKMQELLLELLELSRIGRLVNTPEEMGFSDLAGEAVQLVAGRLMERGVAVEIAPGLPGVYGDRSRLREVLENLIDNAVKFMG
ncbi:MAG TPA: Cache 3/Cache 2 fusion domain-containing protein, partial [Holophaga sp.]|nr:Cache 3/Cache 2 fusion domain-containing protein [Holophaga sp.]